MDGGSMREIRKRFDPALSNIKNIYGCYVTADRSIVTTMEISVQEMDSEEREMYARLLKNTISGPDGRHLHDIPIVSETGDEIRLLKALASCRLEEESMRNLLYERIIEDFDNNSKSYFILLATDTYDIRSKDGDDNDWSEESEEQFTYFVCSICKVKDPKAALRYVKGPKEFRGTSTGSLLDCVTHGFMYPAFVDRQAEVSTVTYYTKKIADIQENFVRRLFGADNDSMPSPALTKKERFDKALEVIGDEYTLEAAARVTKMVLDKMEQEDSSNPDISFEEIGDALKSVPGVKKELVEKLKETGTELLGESISAATIIPKNRMFTVDTGDAEIKTAAENAERLMRRKIDGIWCLVIPITPDADVTINGRKICMKDAPGGTTE